MLEVIYDALFPDLAVFIATVTQVFFETKEIRIFRFFWKKKICLQKIP